MKQRCLLLLALLWAGHAAAVGDTEQVVLTPIAFLNLSSSTSSGITAITLENSLHAAVKPTLFGPRQASISGRVLVETAGGGGPNARLDLKDNPSASPFFSLQPGAQVTVNPTS